MRMSVPPPLPPTDDRIMMVSYTVKDDSIMADTPRAWSEKIAPACIQGIRNGFPGLLLDGRLSVIDTQIPFMKAPERRNNFRNARRLGVIGPLGR